MESLARLRSPHAFQAAASTRAGWIIAIEAVRVFDHLQLLGFVAEAGDEPLCAEEHRAAMDSHPFKTQRDVGSAVVTELRAAGFDDPEEIGRGGFGIVYRCTQVALDRTVAVKVLTAELDENRERFLREQRAMGRLTGHPNIVGVLQVGETEGGYPYLVMPYHRQGSVEVDGRDKPARRRHDRALDLLAKAMRCRGRAVHTGLAGVRV